MTERELLYIKTIADQKSVSKASEKLFLSQPSLSKCIQAVESSLGIKLFKRTSSGLIPTFAGERYYQIACQILKIYNDFEVEISDINSLKKGRITIGTTFYMGAEILPVILPIFKQRCPNIEVFVVENNSSALEKNLLSGELDFAFMHIGPAYEASKHANISFTPLYKEPFLLATKKGHPLGRYAKKYENHLQIEPAIFANDPVVMVNHERKIGQISEFIFQNAKVDPNVVLTTENFETARRLASVGVGITFIPQQYAHLFTDFYPVDSYRISPKYKPYWILGIAANKSTYLSKAAKLFMKIASDQITPENLSYSSGSHVAPDDVKQL